MKPRLASVALYALIVLSMLSVCQGQPPGIVGDCGMAPNYAGTGSVDYVMVYQSKLSEWCIDANFYGAHYATFFNGPFYAYSDTVIAKLQSLFPVKPPNQRFVIEVTQHTGGAHTGCDFPGVSYCNTVTGDAFYNVVNDPVNNTAIPGFYGYLLTLHEAINISTGLVSPGWPTDWWADDRSPFPNGFDYEIMKAVGTEQNNSNLLLAATAQKNRFDNKAQNPSGYDAEVAMFIKFFDDFCEGSPCSGFPAYTRAFKLAIDDRISWPNVSGDTSYTGDNDYSAQLTEYVIAYLQMGFRAKKDHTQTFVDAGVGSAANAIQGQSPYTVDPKAVCGVALAHCTIQAAKGAGQPYSQQLANLQSGSYQDAITNGGTQAKCPKECSWNAYLSQCEPLWPGCASHPPCLRGEIWDGKSCTTGCPATCQYGCYPMEVGQTVPKCKPAP